MTPDPFAAAATGATLVTANAHLARELRRQYDDCRRRSGDRVWESPDILPWSSWLERGWRECVLAGNEPMLLQPAQEALVWEQIISAPGDTEPLLNLPATAELAIEAYALSVQWAIPRERAQYTGHEDAEAFLSWAESFEATCAANGWLAPCRLEAALVDRPKHWAAPNRLLLAGFDELTPRQDLFLQLLASRGSSIETISPERPAPRTASKLGLRDAAEEARLAAAWARDRLERAPGSRIGIVVPDLAARRFEIQRVFDEVLHQGLSLEWSANGRAFHTSIGPPLSENPLASAAFLVLALGRGRIALAEAGLLLRNPFVAGGRSELGVRAALDAELRRRGMADAAVSLIESKADPGLAAALRNWRIQFAKLPRRQSASQWSRSFSRLLDTMGWPGERTLNSAEFQAIQRWNEALSELAGLDAVSQPMSYGDALSRLHRIAATARFAPRDEGAPIQISGLLEASGAEFDHLWVMGLDDRTWPAQPRPNPFLPLPLQRERGVPHSSPERELDYARRVIRRLVGSATELVVSFPLRADDADLRPSAMIAGLPDALAPAPRMGTSRLLGDPAPEIEERVDSNGPPVESGETQHGGTSVLERQAACPFRAFAEFRLGARALEEPVAGLSSQERGKVVHDAMAAFWRQVVTHSNLAGLTPEERLAVVRDSVRAALERQTRERGAEYLPRVQELERQRLERLLPAWLDIEALRPPFEVEATEERRLIEIGGLKLDIRADRVDRLPDGRSVIIDYKTGKPSPSEWEGERPDSPQLPFYCAFAEGSLAAVLFAQLAPGDLRFKGLTENTPIAGADEYSKSKPGKVAGDTLAAHTGVWRDTLERLARDFAAGRADADPKRDVSCEDCPVPALCRAGDRARRVEDTDE